VLPEDVQAVLPGVAIHRLRPAGETTARMNAADIAARLIEAVPIP
jgi:MoxR-like ATPase